MERITRKGLETRTPRFFKILLFIDFTDRLRAIDSTTILQWDVLPGGMEMAGEGDEFGAPVPWAHQGREHPTTMIRDGLETHLVSNPCYMLALRADNRGLGCV